MVCKIPGWHMMGYSRVTWAGRSLYPWLAFCLEMLSQ